MQEAGANQVQELAYTLADGKEYVQAALKKVWILMNLHLDFHSFGLLG